MYSICKSFDDENGTWKARTYNDRFVDFPFPLQLFHIYYSNFIRNLIKIAKLPIVKKNCQAQISKAMNKRG